MTAKECPFTGLPAEREVLHSFVQYKGAGCKFAIAPLAEDELEASAPSLQSRVNCAKRCLEVSGAGIGQRAYWHFRTITDPTHGAALQEPGLVPIALEDALDEEVDHASKPIELLGAIASRLERERKGAFERIQVSHADRVRARIPDASGLTKILEHLHSEGLIVWLDANRETLSQGAAEAQGKWLRVLAKPVRMTVDGWAKIRERVRAANTNKVFIAMQCEWPEDDDVRAQAITAIQNACRASGYEAAVVSQDHTDFITDRIIAEIKRSRFVVAELTYNNRGVYFEAGLARGLDIPVFHVVREGHTSGADAEGKRIHFDIAQISYRAWKTPVELEEKLRDWIEARLGRHRA